MGRNNKQEFHFLCNVEDPSSKIQMSPDLNLMSHEHIKNEFMTIMNHQGIDATGGRHVAIGSFGDVVIFENGVIDMVSDSG
jgi:hypothetical protein